ncbi:replication initiation protein [Piscirickettsia litoralis]|uniref:Initiator Rep protein WH1 domain-containing protein n=1 Tax=Piscirickettsia litoralis TaxID=1891921 RepID=A0ABX2ZWH8_9GAMM|nr:replication initiation protein [Piscirickettsia litoralis]ODN40981.1 hypothetical protein BGC07_18665 [Piscirickettsia litoralis]
MKKQTITKHNHLIEASYRLSLTEMQIVLYGISLINPLNPDESSVFSFDIEIAKFSEMFDRQHSEIYRDLKAAVDHRFWHREFSYYDDQGTQTKQRWLIMAQYNDKSSTIKVAFNPFINKYLSKLKDNFTSYYIEQIAAFKSIYSIRIYEIAAMHLNRSKKQQYKFSYDIEMLKELLELSGKYQLTADLKRYAIEPAVKEINKYSDLMIKYQLKKTGRKYTSIEFFVKKRAINKNKPVRPKRADAIIKIADKKKALTSEQKQNGSAILESLKKTVKS